jgi:hypothetical protein
VRSFAQPDAWSTTILVDEFDTGRFDRAADFLACALTATKFALRGF